MPQYCYVCETCGKTTTRFRTVRDRNEPIFISGCCCVSSRVRRDIQAESHSVRGDYDEPIVSDSMAFDSIDLAEHRRRFPNVDVHLEGRIAQPILRSLSQKKAYLKGRGWVDRN